MNPHKDNFSLKDCPKEDPSLFYYESYGKNILDLNSGNLADEKDRKSGRVLLAGLIRAKTWEELRELAEESDFAEEVAEVMFIANADQRERWQLEAARRQEELEATLKDDKERAEKELKRIEEEKKRVEEEKRQLEEGKRQAEEEKRKAEVGKLRAEQEKQQAEDDNARLREEIQRLKEQLAGKR